MQLPVESQRMHEDEAERLRIELEASRRHEEKLANQLRAQVPLHLYSSSCSCPCSLRGDDFSSSLTNLLLNAWTQLARNERPVQQDARLERSLAENQTTSNGKAGSPSPPNHPGDEALAYTEAAAGAAEMTSKITHEQLPLPQNLAPQPVHETETEQASEAGKVNDAADPSALPEMPVTLLCINSSTSWMMLVKSKLIVRHF